MSFIEDKKIAIAESLINTAMNIQGIAKQFPKTSKRRNIFIKTYNRRPQNKKKIKVLIAKMAFSSLIGAMNVYRIKHQPVPKFKSGSL